MKPAPAPRRPPVAGSCARPRPSPPTASTATGSAPSRNSTTSNAATGRTRRNIVSVAGTTLAADNIPVDVTLAYNRAGGAAANGLVSGTWQATVAGQAQSLGLTWLPVSKNLAYQLRQVPGSTRQLPAVCAPMAAPTPVSTYLSATAGQNILVTLADLRLTQPAIGRDQIYYKPRPLRRGPDQEVRRRLRDQRPEQDQHLGCGHVPPQRPRLLHLHQGGRQQAGRHEDAGGGALRRAVS